MSSVCCYFIAIMYLYNLLFYLMEGALHRKRLQAFVLLYFIDESLWLDVWAVTNVFAYQIDNFNVDRWSFDAWAIHTLFIRGHSSSSSLIYTNFICTCNSNCNLIYLCMQMLECLRDFEPARMRTYPKSTNYCSYAHS